MHEAPSASNEAPSVPLPPSLRRTFAPGRWMRVVILLLGIFIGQAVLYGPSLVGSKILLPLDLLALSGVYLPQTPETERIIPHNPMLSDSFNSAEPHRRFFGRELRAGRHYSNGGHRT